VGAPSLKLGLSPPPEKGSTFMSDFITMPMLLKRNADRLGDTRVAIREKEFGIWQPVTWRGYFENVRDFALGLHKMGFKREDKLSYAGDNRPEGLYSELDVQALGRRNAYWRERERRCVAPSLCGLRCNGW